jgi:hypothetical protein
MQKIDLNIARLKLLLAQLAGKREALETTRHQYREQVERLISVTVHEDADVERTVAMMMDVDARLQQLDRQEHYLEAVRVKAQRELDSLQLTKLIEETRAQIATLRQRESEEGAAREGEPAASVADEIRRLEEVITVASEAAARSISSGR